MRLVLLATVGFLATAALAADATFDDGLREGRRLYSVGDFVGAMAVLRRGADAGHAPSQVLLASILDYAERDQEAVEQYRKAAVQGDPEGQMGLGTMYVKGEGVARNLAEALVWYERAAGKGHAPATQAIAALYLGPAAELAKKDDYAGAQRWIRAAAEGGYLPAIIALRDAYRQGSLGITPDAEQAKRWDDKIPKADPKRRGARANKK